MNALLQYTVQGLAAGSFYALAALGLAIIFGVLGVVNFAHGAFYMLGAVVAAVLLDTLGLTLWWGLLVVPVLMFLFGVLVERVLVRWVLSLDHLYGFLLTFGLTLVLVELVKQRYGVSGLPYQRPEVLQVLPVEPPEAQHGYSDYIFEPSPEAVFNDLLPRYVEVQLYQAILEGLASEYSARMVSMRSASDNAKEIVSELTLSRNKARQAQITAEVSEIAAGANAMAG